MTDDERLYQIAKEITFAAGFDTWTDPRTNITYKNPRTKKKKDNEPTKQKPGKTG